MNGFIFTQRYNTPDSDLMRRLGNAIRCVADGPAPAGVTPTHTCDATGSFHAAAGRLREIQSIPQRPFIFDNSLPAPRVRASIFAALGAVPANSLNIVAYFGHGMPDALLSAHIGLNDLIPFAALLNEKCAPRANVVLYACSAGAPGGFADQLGQMMQKEIWVFGHSSWGSYSNVSMFRRYPGGVPWGGVGRIYGFFNRERERFQGTAAPAATNPGSRPGG